MFSCRCTAQAWNWKQKMLWLLIVSFILWFVRVCVCGYACTPSAFFFFFLLAFALFDISVDHIFLIDITFWLRFLSHLNFYWIELNWIGYSVECQSFLRHRWHRCCCCCCSYYFNWVATHSLNLRYCRLLNDLFWNLMNSCECEFHLELTWDLYSNNAVDVCVPWSDSHSYMNSTIWRFDIWN